MKLKKVITLFCLLMLMCQLLPVRQLGKLLMKGQLIEELAHNDCTPDCKDHFPFKKDFTHADPTFRVSIAEVSASQYNHFADALPQHLPSDIHIPPPNIV